MKIAIPKEPPEENRVAMTPNILEKICKLDATVEIEAGLGACLGFSDEEYRSKGAEIAADRKKMIQEADIILHLTPLSKAEISLMKKNSFLIGFLDPFGNGEMKEALEQNQIHSISMELMPRSTIAQKMDALSSQANLAGYISVLKASEYLCKILPMMTTPAGTIFPAKVFVIGVGVAGLQAIATAKRIGARVEAFDTRPVVKEQVESLGAKFLSVDLGETGETKEGYAKELTSEQMEKQKNAMAKTIAESDIVITTAQLVGKKAPLIVTNEMIQKMHCGSVIVDMATQSGGNVEGSKINEVVKINGIHVIGFAQLAKFVPLSASEMYASNLFHLISHFWDKEKKVFPKDFHDEFLKSALFTQNGKIVNTFYLKSTGRGV